MKTLIMLLLFISGFLIVSGVHEQRLEEANKKRKVVYRYIPRSAIDEQYYGTPASSHFQGMFGEGKSPWLEARTPPTSGPDYDWGNTWSKPPAEASDSESDAESESEETST